MSPEAQRIARRGSLARYFAVLPALTSVFFVCSSFVMVHSLILHGDLDAVLMGIGILIFQVIGFVLCWGGAILIWKVGR
jgi:hypothetical protein